MTELLFTGEQLGRLALQFLLAGAGTLSFAILFACPRRTLPYCGLAGAVGWLVYEIAELFGMEAFAASLLAVIPLTLLARILAMTLRTPVTVFLLTGIFPLVPGAGIYYSAYYFIQGNNALALANGISTFKIAVALAVGIALVLGIPRAAETPIKQPTRPPTGRSRWLCGEHLPAECSGKAETPEQNAYIHKECGAACINVFKRVSFVPIFCTTLDFFYLYNIILILFLDDTMKRIVPGKLKKIYKSTEECLNMKKINRRSFLAAAGLTAAALALTACGGSASSTASSTASSAASSEAASTSAAAELTTVEAGKLTMATNATFPPYEMTTDSGEIEGIDVDTAKAIAEKLGLELQIDDMDFDAALLSVQQGKADIVMAGVTVTDERKAVMDFSDSYATGIQSIIVPNGSDIASPDDLAGKKIGTQRGTTGYIYCSDDFGDDAVVAYDSGLTAVQALNNGQVDAVVIDNAPLWSTLPPTPV